MSRREIFRTGALGLSLGLLLVSCSKPEVPESEGKELSKNPIAAAQQVADAVKKAEAAAKEVQDAKPVDPVHFSKLIELLPPAPAGFTAEGEPRGETTSAMGMTLSKAERRYESGDKSLEVTITDGAYHPQVYMVVTMMSQFKQETTEGWTKGITLEGNPGVEKWEKDGGHSELTVIVGKRFLVQVNAHGVEPEFTGKVYASIDRAKLAALK